MINTSHIFFAGCPLWSFHVEIAAPGAEPFWANPTDAFVTFRRSESGAALLWLGRRVSIVLEPRRLRGASPLLVLEWL